MSDVVNLRQRRGARTLRESIENALENHTGVQSGIVIVFDAEGDMHSYYSCSIQEMALAAARLCYLAGGKDHA